MNYKGLGQSLGKWAENRAQYNKEVEVAKHYWFKMPEEKRERFIKKYDKDTGIDEIHKRVGLEYSSKALKRDLGW